jgi:NAD(P)H-dependent nitrite reductase small subunit
MVPDAVKAAWVGDLPPGTSRLVTLNGVELALFNAGGKLCAIENACPHRGGPLADGTLSGTTVTCPWHAWEFDVTTGACLNNPAAKVRAYPVQVQGNDVLVM